jgi:hypothetical protein
MAYPEHDGHRDCKADEQWIHPSDQQEPGQQPIGERDQEAGQYSHRGQTTDTMGKGIEQLAAVLEGNERSAWSSERERVGSNELALLEHVPPVRQMSGQVTVGIQQGLLEEYGHHHGE